MLQSASMQAQDGAEPRGAQTRRRLLDAALATFGRHGFEAVSTRDLARAAGVNLGAITYHFGSKEAVYLAVAHRIVEQIGRTLMARNREVEAWLSEGRRSRAAALDRLVGILRGLAGFLVRGEETADMAGFIVREQMHPSAAFDVLYEGYIRHFHETCTRLLACALHQQEAAPGLALRAHALIGQVLAFAVARETILRRMRWKSTGRREVRLVAEVLEEHVRALVMGLRRRPGSKRQLINSQ